MKIAALLALLALASCGDGEVAYAKNCTQNEAWIKATYPDTTFSNDIPAVTAGRMLTLLDQETNLLHLNFTVADIDHALLAGGAHLPPNVMQLGWFDKEGCLLGLVYLPLDFVEKLTVDAGGTGI